MRSIDLLDLIGKPFATNGRGPDEYDCYGIIIELAKRLGKYLPEQNTPDGVEMRLKMFESISSEYTEPIPKSELFCVVVFKGGVFGGLHTGMIYPDCQQFIHAGGLNPLKRSVRINRLDSWPWKNRIHGYYRLTKKCQN